MVGRTEEATLVAQRSGHPGLVTVVGPGGIGKTRLVEEALATTEHLWVGFADDEHPEDVIDRISRTLGLTGSPTTARGLAVALGDSHDERLIVLDNVESLLEPIRAVVGELLAADDWAIVATSRVPLGLTVEQRIPMEPLAADDAIELLENEARSFDPTFAFVDAEREAARSLAAKLDHLPLALSLAAARLDIVGPAQLEAQLNSNPRFLDSQLADRPERHRSLDATFDLSWRLLDERERTALCSLSLFDDAFSAASGLGTAGPSELSALRSARFVVAHDDGKLRLLRTIRTRARARFDSLSVEDRTAILRRHLEALGGRDLEFAEVLHLSSVFELLTELDATLAIEALEAWRRQLARFGPSPQTVRLLQRASEFAERQDLPQLPELLGAQARHGSFFGRAESVDLAERALELVEEADDPAAKNTATLNLAVVQLAVGSLQASIERAVRARNETQDAATRCRARLIEAHARYTHTGDPRVGLESLPDTFPTEELRLRCSTLRATFLLRAGRLRDAADLGTSLVTELDRAGYDWLRGSCAQTAGMALVLLGDSEGLEYLRESAEASHNVADRRVRALFRWGWGKEWLAGDGLDELLRAVSLVGTVDRRLYEATAFTLLGFAYLRRGRPESGRAFHQAFLVAEQQGDVDSAALSLALEAHAVRRTGGAEPSGTAERARALAAHCNHLTQLTGALLTDTALQDFDLLDASIASMRRHPAPVRDDGCWQVLRDAVAVARREVPGPPQARDPALQADKATLVTDADSRSVRLPDGEELDLSRRGAIRHILTVLLEAHRAEPGRPVAVETLFERGWPGQHLAWDLALKRVYTGVWKLRQLGFEDLIVTTDDGYFLKPDLTVSVR